MCLGQAVHEAAAAEGGHAGGAAGVGAGARPALLDIHLLRLLLVAGGRAIVACSNSSGMGPMYW